jgi:uncharacterized OB-fold protein
MEGTVTRMTPATTPDETTEGPLPPLPQPDPVTQFFWDGVAAGELRIQRCQTCGHYIHYPKVLCRYCQSDKLEGERVSGRATLYTWTVAVQPFHPFYVDRIPYLVATVELVEEPGLMFLTQLVDCTEDDLHIGMPLEVTFVELHPELTLPFFRPASDTEGNE